MPKKLEHAGNTFCVLVVKSYIELVSGDELEDDSSGFQKAEFYKLAINMSVQHS